MKFSISFVMFGLCAVELSAFLVPNRPACAGKTALHLFTPVDEALFAEDEEIIPIAEAYIHTKYKQGAESHGHKLCTKEDAREVLRSVLPPVTPEELEEEVTKTLSLILKNPANSDDCIQEDDFVKAIVKNSYWEEAGDVVVKELMYFDSLYNYYQNGSPLLKNDDYETLKDSLTWDGSSVVTMNKNEALFVTAVAAAKRGEPLMDDDEYSSLKAELKKDNSWVTARAKDNLERLGLNSFLGYLHRALA